MKKVILIIFFVLIIINNLYSQDTTDNSSISINNTVNETTNQSSFENLSKLIVPDLELIKFFPNEVKLGDIQFNIQVKNNNDTSFNDVAAFISGKGFSTYDIIPIDKLGPYEKDYIFVNGNFRESGMINLTIKIDNYIFYEEINVIDVNEDRSEGEMDLEKLSEISTQLENLKKNYTSLELEISEKKDDGYDISRINLDDVKRYIRLVESNILSGNLEQAEINMKLAYEEYEYQEERVDNLRVIPILTRIKENALIFSAIFGVILTFFALSELIKQKSQRLAKGVVGLAKKERDKKRKKFRRR